MHISLKWLGRFARNQRQMKEKKKCLCDFDVRLLMRCLVFKIYAIKVGQFCQNMVKKWTFSENMRTPVLLTPGGDTTSTLHYFCLKLHHFTSQMTPIDTHFFIPIPSKTRFCKTLSDFCAKLATFQNHSAAKGLNDENRNFQMRFFSFVASHKSFEAIWGTFENSTFHH